MTEYSFLLLAAIAALATVCILMTVLFVRKGGGKATRHIMAGCCVVALVCCGAAAYSALATNNAKVPPVLISEYEQQYEFDTLTTLYFTPSGSSYHLSKTCRYLAKSETVLSGTYIEALKQGAHKPCSACAQAFTP